MGFATYSLKDVKTVLKYDAYKNVLSDNGAGRISWTYAGDMSAMTTTATGYVVINRLVAKNGSLTIEVPVNSPADDFMRKWVKWLKEVQTSNYGVSSVEVSDPAGGRDHSFLGVVPQKEPDETYDQTAGNRTYNLLFAELVTTVTKTDANNA